MFLTSNLQYYDHLTTPHAAAMDLGRWKEKGVVERREKEVAKWR
jgi:hypothetical protein